MASPIVAPEGASLRASRAIPTQHEAGAHNALAYLRRGAPPAAQCGASQAMTGVQLVHVECSTLPGEVEAGDLMCIDFDQHSVARDGLYVVQLGNWTGVRRFADTLSGLRVLDVDRWRPVGRTVRILGYVAEVYAPRRPVEGVCHG